ncbi:phospholipase C [Candidatus Solirubrobacter pratensis]|uniref:phospholipase C n=1 Tax=Candidatus Solirubrobacter pratensis TaxID=1298857 RepID=UPI000419EDAB|nr:alkaline phosphatase family protein [Candidatus Solirubrobacter pratensis]
MRTPSILAGGLAAAAAAVAVGLTAAHADTPSAVAPSTTPIKHLVVIFGENISFDHYFGTYPNAANPPGEPRFNALPDTPSVNGLNQTLLENNPNSAAPKRLDRSQAVTCSQNHGYSAEQSAFDNGLMDKFPENTASDSCTFSTGQGNGVVMDYYDGNTVTGMWNLAQHFAMSDNSFDTNFGPSTVGAINLISGQTHGTDLPTAGGVENNTVIGDPDPAAELDDCGVGGVKMSGKNVGDLLNKHSVTWGWFQGGFRPTSTSNGKSVCGATHVNVANGSSKDYSAHHEPFEYYASTANPHHVAPTSVNAVGTTDPANHQYDLSDFDKALASGNLPSVSFLKAAAFEDGHPSNSDPLDEQRFVTRTINALEQSPEWSSTAVVLAYDDSDGWYDHVMSPIVSPSAANADRLNGAGKCGNVPAGSTAYTDRCGYGPRLPLMVVSPYAKQNFVDHSLTDQTSILKFIEDNWNLGRIGDQSFDAKAGSLENMFDFSANGKRAPKVFLDPETGEVVKTPPDGTPSGNPTPTPTPGLQGQVTVGGTVEHGNADDLSVAAGTITPPANGTPVTTTSGKPAKLKLSCSTKGGGKKVSVSCTATGTDAKSAGIAVRFRIAKGRSILATTSTKLSKGKTKATLRSKKALKGKYTLRIAITHKGGVTGISQSIRL